MIMKKILLTILLFTGLNSFGSTIILPINSGDNFKDDYKYELNMINENNKIIYLADGYKVDRSRYNFILKKKIWRDIRPLSFTERILVFVVFSFIFLILLIIISFFINE